MPDIKPAKVSDRPTYKQTIFKEIKLVMRLAWALMITMMSQMYMQPIATMFGGRLSTIELDAIALSNTIINVFGTSIIHGMTGACDTMFTQTYGSTNKKYVGINLQRALIIHLLTLIPCYTIQLNMPHLLLAMGQHPEVVRLTKNYLRLFFPGLISLCLYQVLKKYMECQAIVIPNIIIGIFGIAVHIAAQYVMLFYLKLGVFGSVLAQNIAYLVLFIVTLGYIILSGLYKKTWPGWSKSCLVKWGEFAKHGAHGVLMMCLEWWAYEILVLLSGLLGTVEVAVMTIIFNLNFLLLPIASGFAGASGILIGHALGAGDPLLGKLRAKVGLVTVTIASGFTALIVLFLRNELPLVFTNIPEVVEATSDVLYVVAACFFMSHSKCLGRSLMRATGKQNIGSLFVFLSFYLVGLPLAIPVMLLTSLGIKGPWIGMGVASLVCDLLYFVFMLRSN